jgi:hypothetical protein
MTEGRHALADGSEKYSLFQTANPNRYCRRDIAKFEIGCGWKAQAAAPSINQWVSAWCPSFIQRISLTPDDSGRSKEEKVLRLIGNFGGKEQGKLEDKVQRVPKTKNYAVDLPQYLFSFSIVSVHLVYGTNWIPPCFVYLEGPAINKIFHTSK